jgi:hypothetical protein
MGDVDLNDIDFNKLQFIEIRERLITCKLDLKKPQTVMSYEKAKDLYRRFLYVLKLYDYDAFYKFQPLKFDECIKTANVVINAMSSKSQKEWIIFDVLDITTHPEEGSEVLCYVPGWAGYNVFHLVYEDGGKVTWRYDDDIVDQEKYFPLVWQYIDQNHVKTKNDHQ